MAAVLQCVKHYQRNIERGDADDKRTLRCIEKLYHLPVTVQLLQDTGVGRTVNALRKGDGEVASAARALVSKWKQMVAEEEEELENNQQAENRYDNEPHCSYSNREEIRLSENRGYQNSPKNDINTKPKYNDDHKRSDSYKRKDDGDDTHRKDDGRSGEEKEYGDKDRKRKHYKERDEPKKVKFQKMDRDDSSHDDDSKSENSDSTNDSSDDNHSDAGNSDHAAAHSEASDSSSESKKASTPKQIPSQTSKVPQKQSDSDNRTESNPHKPKSSDHNSDKHSSNLSKSSSKPSAADARKDDSKKSSHSHSGRSEKSESKSSHEKSDKHTKSSGDRERSGKDKSSSGKDRHAKESNGKSSGASRDIQSGKESQSYKSSHSSRDGHRDKHSSNRDKRDEKDSSSHRDRHGDRRKHSKERKTDSKERKPEKHSSSDTKKISSSSSSSKHEHRKDDSEHKKKDQPSSVKKESSRHESSSREKTSSKSIKVESKTKSSSAEKKKKIYDTHDGIDGGSGASFAEALGMISPSKVQITSKKKPSNSKYSTDTHEETNRNKPSDDITPSLLHPSTKLSPLPPLTVSVSALPDISPNYVPRPAPKLIDVPLHPSSISEEEALKVVMNTKNQRTKVYSGNKVIHGSVPSLYDLCVIVLQENINALEYTGGVPYDIIKPVVDKANPEQLFMLEHYNPYLINDTDSLWQIHSNKRFRNKQRQEFESWREMYLRCCDEQEAKLKSLTANIKMSQDKSLPVRQTKMAYVDSAVKPPRGIARKQAIYGTARKPVASPSARVASLANHTVFNAMTAAGVHSPSTASSSAPRPSSGFIKPKKAPLMQKALQFMKGRTKR